jgi:hypothetical protein
MRLYEKLGKVNTDGIIKTVDLISAGIYYADIQKLLSEGVIGKVWHGYNHFVSKAAKKVKLTILKILV